MAYSRTIKQYQADGSTLIGTLDNVLKCKFNLAMTGGCLGGELVLSGSVRDDYALAAGTVIKCFYSGSTPLYSGVIVSRQKMLADHAHVYELAGAWTALSNAVIDEDRVFTGQTVGAIARALLTDYVVAAVPLVSSNTSLIVSEDITLAEYTIKPEDLVSKHLTALAVIASGSTVAAVGVGADLKLYLQAVPTESSAIQGEAEIASTAVSAKEIGEPAQNNNRVAVVGSVSKDSGFRAKKTFTNGALPHGRPIVARVPGLTGEADLSKFADGWFTRYADPGLQVDDLIRVPMRSTENPPIPWSGQYKYTDLQTGDKKTDYLSAVDYDFNEPMTMKVQLGLSGSGDRVVDSDPYAPSSSDGIDGPADDELLDLPDATDLTPPADDTPFMVTPDMLDDLLEDFGGLASLQVLSMSVPGAAVTDSENNRSDRVHVTVTLSDGGTELVENDHPVTAFAYFYDEVFDGTEITPGTLTNTYSETLSRVKSDGNIEVWGTTTGFSMPMFGGFLKCAVRVEKPNTDPAEYQWYPSNVSLDGDDLLIVRVIDVQNVGGGSGGTYIVQAGWLSDGV